MGKIVASYQVRVVLREPHLPPLDAPGPVPAAPPTAPTNDLLAAVISGEIDREFAGAFDVSVSSERLDK